MLLISVIHTARRRALDNHVHNHMHIAVDSINIDRTHNTFIMDDNVSIYVSVNINADNIDSCYHY